MNALAPVQDNPRPARQIVEDVIPILDTARFEHMQRIATIMANASLVPEQLRTYREGDKTYPLPFEQIMANCFLVVNQATKWNMDPFGVAQCVSVVKGKLCYEGKLVAAVLDAKLGIELTFTYNGKTGDALGVVVSGVINGVTKTVEGTVGGWKTTGSNSPWSSPNNHQRQLAYRGSREWARVHKPALMLGAYTDDELADMQDASRANRARDVSPPPPPPPTIQPPATTPAIEDAQFAESQTAVTETSSRSEATQDAGAPPPLSNDAPASDPSLSEAISPDDILANLAEVLATATDAASIEEGYVYLDVEAELSGFDGYVEKARALRGEHLARVEKVKPVIDEAPAPPPTLADDETSQEPEETRAFDLNGWREIEHQQSYIGYAEMLVDHAKKVGDFAIVETFWTDSQPVRAKLIPLKERNSLKDALLARWEKA